MKEHLFRAIRASNMVTAHLLYIEETLHSSEKDGTRSGEEDENMRLLLVDIENNWAIVKAAVDESRKQLESLSNQLSDD